MGLAFLVLAAFLAGGVIAFHRQGKPVVVQVLLGLAAAGLLVLGLTTGLTPS